MAHFDIEQQNVPVLSFPQTTPPRLVLVPGQTSKGVDTDNAWQVAPSIDVMATFAILDAKGRTTRHRH